MGVLGGCCILLSGQEYVTKYSDLRPHVSSYRMDYPNLFRLSMATASS